LNSINICESTVITKVTIPHGLSSFLDGQLRLWMIRATTHIGQLPLWMICAIAHIGQLPLWMICAIAHIGQLPLWMICATTHIGQLPLGMICTTTVEPLYNGHFGTSHFWVIFAVI